ncbi:MAG TPA: glutamate--cysteine ligase [Stackebrandtia sp.]|nr:glutamate--cysteine ligase [Stackebrandtia sp.]HZE39784.1 glutamate--cysteine ligase [Stackebrandtia sp.]
MKLRRCLEALRLLQDKNLFDMERTLTGVELELSLISETGEPAMRNLEVLSNLAKLDGVEDMSVQAELGRFNLEMNLPPRPIKDNGLGEYEEMLRRWLAALDDCARQANAAPLLIGITPTFTHDAALLDNLSPLPRYRLLNDQILAARGEDIALDIHGAESLQTYTDSIAPESANTSVQIHIQVTPEQFPRYWNAAQAIAGVQVALGANSPYLFGSQLWAETRIIVFEQATDVRCDELRTQGVRPRTFFGERWVASAIELFEENLRYFMPLLPVCDHEDPVAAVARGDIPHLGELRLHNGTIYRWNRPVYDVTDAGPHLRVENRVLPTGPTLIDICANMAFYLGLVTALAEQEVPVWTKLPFAVAENNFIAAAKHGIDALQVWPGLGEVPARVLARDHLLPLARQGLRRLQVDERLATRLLSIIEGRCATGVNGAVWQVATVNALQEERGMSRPEALRAMLLGYRARAETNTPVHDWPPLLIQDARHEVLFEVEAVSEPVVDR